MYSISIATPFSTTIMTLTLTRLMWDLNEYNYGWEYREKGTLYKRQHNESQIIE